jgi:hypothetical protein
MAANWAVFTFGGSGPAITAHGSLDLIQKKQLRIQIRASYELLFLKHTKNTTTKQTKTNKYSLHATVCRHRFFFLNKTV